MLDSCKMVEKQSEAFHTFLWHFFHVQNRILLHIVLSKVSYCIFEIHQQWQSDFSWEYSNSCCSYSFESEIIRIGQSSHKMYSNSILNFEESTIILKAHTKKVWKLIVCTSYIYIYIYIYITSSTLADCTDFSDSLSPSISTIYHSRWSSTLHLVSTQSLYMKVLTEASMCKNPQENVCN